MHPTTLLTKLAYAEALSRAAALRLRTLTEDTDRLVHRYDELLAHTQGQLHHMNQQFGVICDEFQRTMPTVDPIDPCLADLAYPLK